MSHPSEAELIAFADGELNRDRRRMMDVHLSGCGLCRHALRDLEGAMVGLTVELALIDAAEPSAWRMPASASDQRPASPRSPQGRTTTSTQARRRPLSLHATPSSDPRRGERAPAGLPRIQVVTMRWAAALVLVVAGGGRGDGGTAHSRHARVAARGGSASHWRARRGSGDPHSERRRRGVDPPRARGGDGRAHLATGRGRWPGHGTGERPARCASDGHRGTRGRDAPPLHLGRWPARGTAGRARIGGAGRTPVVAPLGARNVRRPHDHHGARYRRLAGQRAHDRRRPRNGTGAVGVRVSMRRMEQRTTSREGGDGSVGPRSFWGGSSWQRAGP